MTQDFSARRRQILFFHQQHPQKMSHLLPWILFFQLFCEFQTWILTIMGWLTEPEEPN